MSNVGVRLAAPEGWLVEVLDGSDNVFAEVAPGASVTTTWLVTAPAEAAGTAADLTLSATYRDDCAVKQALDRVIDATVSDRARIPAPTMTASASSEEQAAGPSEVPAALAIDGNPSTIWHSRWSASATSYPHWLMVELDQPAVLDGIGYQRRPANRNGPIRDYVVEVSMDGSAWTTVASGQFQDVAQMQSITFAPVEASFLRLTALSSISGTQFAAIAELAVYGAAAAPGEGHAPRERADDDPSGCQAQPVVELGAERVNPRAWVDVTLSGFPAGAQVEMRLDGSGPVLARLRIGEDGSATGRVRMPPAASHTTHELVASVEGEQLATAQIEIRPGRR